MLSYFRRGVLDCYENNRFLLAVTTLGSALEGILVGMCLQHERDASGANSAPKVQAKGSQQSVPPVTSAEWTLERLINVASEVEWIGKEVNILVRYLQDSRNL